MGPGCVRVCACLHDINGCINKPKPNHTHTHTPDLLTPALPKIPGVIALMVFHFISWDFTVWRATLFERLPSFYLHFQSATSAELSAKLKAALDCLRLNLLKKRPASV